MSILNKPINPAIDLLRQKMSGLVTKEGREKAASFVPRPNDVIVVTHQNVARHAINCEAEAI